MSRRKKHGARGHYCWACDRHRANERFSGHGHARHVCRDCQKLGAKELAYLQAVRDLEFCLDFDGLIVRKRRRAFERFKQHEDPRIRVLAAEVESQDQQTRAMMNAADAEAHLQEIEGADRLEFDSSWNLYPADDLASWDD